MTTGVTRSSWELAPDSVIARPEAPSSSKPFHTVGRGLFTLSPVKGPPTLAMGQLARPEAGERDSSGW